MKLLPATLCAATLFALPAHATFNISKKPTRNVDCNRGFCFANADQANLNVDDLAALLATSDIRVLTEDEVLQDIEVLSPLAWTSGHALSLESEDAIFIRSTITVEGTAHLSFVVPGGPQFEKGGAVRFWDKASQLTIEGTDYRLVASIADIAAAVAADPQAVLALAGDYDAKPDGRYKQSPVDSFAGTFEGLGNRILNLTVSDKDGVAAGLFGLNAGTVQDFGLLEARISGSLDVGALAGENPGQILNCFATGAVKNRQGAVGGLVGLSGGSVIRAWADVKVSGTGVLGGLVGGIAGGQVVDAYAMGAVSGGDASDVGGLVGDSTGLLSHGYATGAVSGKSHSHVGGVVGATTNGVVVAYWDTDTSGAEAGVGQGKQEGVLGLTTAQLLAGAADGLDDGAWTQSAKLNGGFPYLVTSPPLK